MHFAQLGVTDTNTEFGIGETLNGTVTQNRVTGGIMDVLVITRRRFWQGWRIIAASTHAETEYDAGADVGAVRVGDVTITGQQALRQCFVCFKSNEVTDVLVGVEGSLHVVRAGTDTIGVPGGGFHTSQTVTRAEDDLRRLQFV